MSRTIYRNARVFTAEPSAPGAEAFVVDGSAEKTRALR